MLKESLISFALVLLVEAVSAIVEYLKHRLIHQVNRQDEFADGYC